MNPLLRDFSTNGDFNSSTLRHSWL